VGASQKREVSSRLKRLCRHLLKWRYQPEHRSRSWSTTIYLQRDELQDLFKDTHRCARSPKTCSRRPT
jgi:hypothetical protein